MLPSLFVPVLLLSAVAPADLLAITLPDPATPVLQRIADVASRQIEARSGIKAAPDKSAFIIELAVDGELPPEGYRIADREGGVLISGADDHYVIYGVGKFLRDSRYADHAFTPGAWRGTLAPDGWFRAVYAATHFNNFYEAAPAEEVAAYIEELALWGANAVVVHFPTWNFTGFDDPGARRNLEQTRRILSAAKAVGMKAGIIQCPNQGFTTAPDTVRAVANRDPSRRRGNMGINCCPSTPEGMKYLLDLYTRLFDAYKDIGLDYFISWPYDEGGCGCDACAPWGGNAFPALSEAVAIVGRNTHPGMKTILSTWLYDLPPSGEWAGLAARLESNHAWLDAIMCDDHFDFPRYPLDHGVPAGLPLYNFPEISMWGRSPWGGFGANPLPARYERLWNQVKGAVSGGMPYSEGIFEDINKVMCFQFYWDRDRAAEDTLREYAAYEYSPESAERVVEAVRLLEQAWETRGPASQAAFDILKEVDATLPNHARTSWRWRILYLRGLIDSQIVAQEGKLEGDMLRDACRELTEIYHAQEAHRPVKPPEIP